jgi:hypothetical protein
MFQVSVIQKYMLLAKRPKRVGQNLHLIGEGRPGNEHQPMHRGYGLMEFRNNAESIAMRAESKCRCLLNRVTEQP